jgi:hypothetical protein
MNINYKKTCLVVLVLVAVCASVLSGCNKSGSDNMLGSDKSQVEAMATSSQLNVRLYKYDVGVNDKPAETELFLFDHKKFESDTLNFLNEIFGEDGLSFSSATVDMKEKCITADISQEVASLLDGGEDVAAALTSEIVVTLLNMPGIEKVVLTIDGKRDCSGPNYNFKGTFIKTGEITFKQDEGK